MLSHIVTSYNDFMKAFYPRSTNQILHRSKTGEVYVLDNIDNYIRLADALKQDNRFEVIDVEAVDVNLAKSLFNSAHDPNLLDFYTNAEPNTFENGFGLMWQPKLTSLILEQSLSAKYVIDDLESSNVSLAVTGGGHHAQYKKPFGFCGVNTLAIASLYASEKYKVAVIDLDTHYSNGTFDILLDKPNIYCISIWNQILEKWAYHESGKNIWHKKVTDINSYKDSLDDLKTYLLEIKPTLVIYHLGLDPLETDRLGGVPGMSLQELFEREKFIKDLSKELNAKVGIFLGGGYIDRTNGQTYAEQLRTQLTTAQYEIICSYLDY